MIAVRTNYYPKKKQLKLGTGPFGRHFRVTIVDFLSVSVRVSSLEVALDLVLQRISREPARECATSALRQSTAAQIEAFSKIGQIRPVFL